MGGLFSSPAPMVAQAPVVTPPTPMPTPDDAAVKAAKAKSNASMLSRRGRQSSINTQGDPVDTLA